MAQYNLVGYNSAPTNVEYDIMKSGMDKTPRTNWAEYSLKKDQLKEQKKQNRIQNALNIVNTIATGVNTYENVLNSELQRDSQKLLNDERALDIQSKSIEVNKKITETKADLDFTTKLREYQKANDIAGALQYMLADPKTANRNKVEAQAMIELAKFNSIPNADNVYTALFPEEAYKHKQDELNRQTQLQVASIHEAGATRRAQMQIDAQQPLHNAQINLANAHAEYYQSQINGGQTIQQQRKQMNAFNTSKDNLYNEVAIDPNMSEANDGNIEQTIEDLTSGNTRMVNLNNIQSQATILADIKQRLSGGVNTNDALTRIVEDLGDSPKSEDLSGWATSNPKLRLLVTDHADGTRSYYMVKDSLVKAAQDTLNKGTTVYSQNVLQDIYYKDGDLSKLSTYQLNALSQKSKTELDALNETFGGNLLVTATPKQQRTPAFKKLASTLEQPVQQPTTSVSEALPTNTLGPAIEGAKDNKTLFNLVSQIPQEQRNAFAAQGLALEQGLQQVTDTQKENIIAEVSKMPERTKMLYALRGLKAVNERETNKRLSEINPETTKDEIGKVTDIAIEMPGISVEEQVSKMLKDNQALIKSSNVSHKEQQIVQQYKDAIEAAWDKFGDLAEKYPDKTVSRVQSDFWNTPRFDSKEAVENYYRVRIKPNLNKSISVNRLEDILSGITSLIDSTIERIQQ